MEDSPSECLSGSGWPPDMSVEDCHNGTGTARPGSATPFSGLGVLEWMLSLNGHAHVHFSLLRTVNVTSLLQVPILVSPQRGQLLTATKSWEQVQDTVALLQIRASDAANWDRFCCVGKDDL